MFSQISVHEAVNMRRVVADNSHLGRNGRPGVKRLICRSREDSDVTLDDRSVSVMTGRRGCLFRS